MKKFLTSLCVLACLFATVGIAACDEKEKTSEPSTTESTTNDSPVEITGVTFDSKEYTYDGSEKELLAVGIPDGVTAVYKDNKGTNAGSYSASVTLSGEGYITKTLTATLTIAKKDIAGVTLAQDSEVNYDGERHFPALSGTLPTGATMVWKFNGSSSEEGVKTPNEYEVELVISCPNHNDLMLTANFTIRPDYAKMAEDVLGVFDVTPDPWSYLPDSLKMENKVIEAASVPAYDDFVAVESIPTNYIGQQLDEVYKVLNVCDVALQYVTKVNGALNSIQQAYQTFLSNSPTNEEEFSGTVTIGGVQCAYAIVLDDSYYTLTVNVSGVEVYLFGDIGQERYGARVQINEDTLLKYEIADDKLIVALNVLDNFTNYIEFMKSGTDTLGYVYRYAGVGSASTVSSALLKVDGSYTTIVGTMGDFIPTADGRNCEVYSNATGKMVGTEVREEISALGQKVGFDTCWYQLKDVAGILSIKKALEGDDVYINGSDAVLETKNVGGVTLTTASRRFDIEFKQVRAYRYNATEEKYESVEFDVPMLFIQEGFIDDFATDFEEKNSVAVSLSVLSVDKDAVEVGYHTLVAAYNQIVDLVTQQTVEDFCKKKAV